MLNIIEYKNNKFVIQAYLKDDFVNVSIINGDSFQIDFVNNTIETSGKETIKWLEIKRCIDISEFKSIVDSVFNKLTNNIP